MNRLAAWWRLWFVWVIPAVLVALNVVWLTGLRSVLLGRGSLLAREVQQVDGDVARLEAEKRELAQAQVSLDHLKEGLTTLRSNQLGPMRERLVPFLTEIVRRAQDAGLRPEQIGYSYQRDEKSGLVRFTATYSLKGTYEQVRRCILSLERSPQFIIVENLGLSGPSEAISLDVGVRLVVATYFSDADEGLLANLHATEEATPTAGAVATPQPEAKEVPVGE